jgi:hypothetical protein
VNETQLLEQGSVFIFWMFVTQNSMGVLLGILAQRTLALDWRATLTGTPAVSET